ncbi:MAG: shikimate dehydrogenase [Pirellulales bacterium]|nr:shikimate dehydrogenase [Pirellulales bacterium]
MVSIDAKTTVCAVLGHPIGHSLSPALHNAAFEALGLPLVYVAHDVAPGNVTRALEGIRVLGYRGLSITIPHKVEAMHGVDHVDAMAAGIGCINTVVNDHGRLLGSNSDGLGALGGLRDANANPDGKNVLILGSGGAARAIAITLARETEPRRITILGIELDELNRLISDVRHHATATVTGGQFTDASLRAALAETDILMHCSPIGMHPNEESSLVSPDMFRKGMVVFDAVYNPRRTKLLRDAQVAGCQTIEGIEMFLGQAAVQFELWTGRQAPRSVMRRVVEAHL